MREVAVVNASPLIYLSKVDQLSLLRLIAPQVIVPAAVMQEIAAKGENNLTRRAILREAAWLTPAKSIALPASVLAWDLGFGESAVIATALEYSKSHGQSHCPAIIDDALGRKCAKTLGVELFGTLGLVLIAKQHGTINSARALLGELRINGMYLAPSVIDGAVELVGE